jgi:cation transport ATPase
MTSNRVNNAPSLKVANIRITLSSRLDIVIKAMDIVLLESFLAIIYVV